MKKALRIVLFLFLGVIVIFLAGIGYNYLRFQQINSRARKILTPKETITVDGMTFRDLNGNGTLDIYEDHRQPVGARVEDLLSQMTVEEKVGMMWHLPIAMGDQGEILKQSSPQKFFFGSTYDYLVNRKLRHFNLFFIPDPESHARWYNALQEIAEQDRLGIPVTISSDPRHGISNFLNSDMLSSQFSKWPEPVGLAAIGDSMTMVEFGRIANQEYRAVGIRTALHPMADLATEPRWARINGTFGEDAELAAKLTAAYIYGFQGDSLDANSVACMTKHWPGGGPQEDGEDAHFRYGANQLYPGDNFDYHLIPFEAAFEAGTAMIMPYYGIPLDQTSENVGMSFNKEIIRDLLRDEYGYDGVVCTDWSIIEGAKIFGIEIVSAKDHGVADLSIKEKIAKAMDAGVDQFGGNANTEEMLQLVEEGLITESRRDESVRRLLKVKVELGLVDDPYVYVGQVQEIVGNPKFVARGKEAQRRSIVLLKNEQKPDSSFHLPLSSTTKVYIENLDPVLVASYATVVDSLEAADYAILHLSTPYEPRNGDIIEQMFHQGYLDFQEPEKSRMLSIMEDKPTIICLSMDRPAVMPEINDLAAGLVVDFGVEEDAILDIVFGKASPRGRLPFEIPSSMEEVRMQREDVPYDTPNPLYEFGAGLTYEQEVITTGE